MTSNIIVDPFKSTERVTSVAVHAITSKIEDDSFETSERVVKEERNQVTPVAAQVVPHETPERVVKEERNQVTPVAAQVEPIETRKRKLNQVSPVQKKQKITTLLDVKEERQTIALHNEEIEDGEVLDSETSVPQEISKKRPICRYFANNTCRWGSQCRFRHPISYVEPQHKPSAELDSSFTASLNELKQLMKRAGYNVNKPRESFRQKPWIEYNDLDTDPYYTKPIEMKVDQFNERLIYYKEPHSQGPYDDKTYPKNPLIKAEKAEMDNLTYSGINSRSTDKNTSTTRSNRSPFESIPRGSRANQTSRCDSRIVYMTNIQRTPPHGRQLNTSSSSSSDSSSDTSYTSSTETSEQSSAYMKMNRYNTSSHKSMRSRSPIYNRNRRYIKQCYRSRSRSRSPIDYKRKYTKTHYSQNNYQRRERY